MKDHKFYWSNDFSCSFSFFVVKFWGSKKLRSWCGNADRKPLNMNQPKKTHWPTISHHPKKIRIFLSINTISKFSAARCAFWDSTTTERWPQLLGPCVVAMHTLSRVLVKNFAYYFAFIAHGRLVYFVDIPRNSQPVSAVKTTHPRQFNHNLKI